MTNEELQTELDDVKRLLIAQTLPLVSDSAMEEFELWKAALMGRDTDAAEIAFDQLREAMDRYSSTN